MLLHLMRENSIRVESMDTSRKDSKSKTQIKLKEMHVNKLIEQLRVRDDMLEQARIALKDEEIDEELEDPRHVPTKDLLAGSDFAGFPVIGKATNHLI